MDISRAEKLAENIDTIYKKVSNHITLAKKLGPAFEGNESIGLRFGRRETDTSGGENKTELLKIQYGSLYIEVSKDDAETALRLVAQKLGVKLTNDK